MSMATDTATVDTSGPQVAHEDTGASSVLDSTESIIDALEKHDAGGKSEAPQQEASPDAEPEPDAEREEKDTDTGQEAEEEAAQEAQPEETVAPPVSWKPEEKELFLQLPPDLQKTIARREGEREKALTLKAQEAAEAGKKQAEIYAHVENTLGRALMAAQVAVEADFAGVDWLKLQQTDPVTFLQLDAQRKQRLQAVEQAVASYNQAAMHKAESEKQAHGRQLKSELETFLPKLQALMGEGFDRKQYRQDMEGYLKSVGAPEEHIRNVSHGYLLELATKAMLYDRQAKAREAGAKKVREAPKVMQATKARTLKDSGPDYKRARHMIKSGGSSTENITRALEEAGF